MAGYSKNVKLTGSKFGFFVSQSLGWPKTKSKI